MLITAGESDSVVDDVGSLVAGGYLVTGGIASGGSSTGTVCASDVVGRRQCGDVVAQRCAWQGGVTTLYSARMIMNTGDNEQCRKQL